MLKIHAIQTGTVRVKVCQRVGQGRGIMRQVNILLDRSWSDSLPIYAWAVETSEGVVVVDTGETARTAEPGYFPRWHPYFRLAVRLNVTPEQEVGPQLLNRTDGRGGLRPSRSSSSPKPLDRLIEVTVSRLIPRLSSCRPQDTRRGTSLWLSWMTTSTTSWLAIRPIPSRRSSMGKSTG
jgi:hypothetical protein